MKDQIKNPEGSVPAPIVKESKAADKEDKKSS